LIYNNLLYFITAIIIFSTGSVPDEPQIPLGAALIIFMLKGAAYYWLAHHAHASGRTSNDKKYFAVEQKFSLFAIFIFAIDIYVLDIKYYLSFLSLKGNLPALLSLAGILLFFFYLSLLWLAARKNYQEIFRRRYSARKFISTNIKLNLPIVLPWLIINFFADILKILPFPFSKMLASSEWGESILFLLFFILLAIIFPVLIKNLWNCQPIPAGPARAHMEGFCKQQNFKYSDIMPPPLASCGYKSMHWVGHPKQPALRIIDWYFVKRSQESTGLKVWSWRTRILAISCLKETPRFCLS